MRRVAAVLLLVLGTTLAPSGVWAAELAHRVGAGESASAIAKRYYGDYDLAPLLLAYNGRQGTMLRVGETLRIPDCPEHAVRPGDTWSVLARRYLGRPEAWKSVAFLNGVHPEQPLRVGQTLVFPVVLRHDLRRGESLAILAERYYGDPRRGDLLREFNAIDDPRRLSVGQSVEVPLVAFRQEAPPATHAERKEPEAPDPVVQDGEPPAATPTSTSTTARAESPETTSPAALSEPRQLFEEPLREAAVALAQGRFDDGRERLAALRGPVSTRGTPGDQAELWKLLLALHVAYDNDEQACLAYRSLATLSAPVEADPDLVSPKVREAIDHCAAR